MADREDLLLRWNKAAGTLCAGSEFVDEPERVFARIREQLRLAKEVGRRLGAADVPGKIPTAESAVKACEDCGFIIADNEAYLLQERTGLIFCEDCGDAHFDVTRVEALARNAKRA